MDTTHQIILDDLACKFYSLAYDVDPKLFNHSEAKLLKNLKRVAALDPTAILNSIITEMENNGKGTV